MPIIGPVSTAMVTPFTPDGALDLDGAATLARHLVDNGTNTIVVHGTTGESPTVKTDEIWPLLEVVIDAVKGRGTVMCGTGNNDTASSVALTAQATALGVDALLVVTPYYNRPDQRGLTNHFTTIASCTDKPVFLYDIPARTGREIELETILRLADSVENIVGVKDAHGDLVKASRVIGETGGEFEVHSGIDELNLPFLAVGASGFVSVVSHLTGNDLAEMVRIFGTDMDKARAIHHKLLPIIRAVFAEPSPAPLKGALQRLGLPSGPVRPPMLEALPATVDAVMASLADAGLAPAAA
jgi:4-hydroxy-tetrahydrodipicolinate synthase